MAAHLSARELLELALDHGSWVSWDRPPGRVGFAAAYVAELIAAEERSGADEAVLTGEGRVHGRRVAVIVSEFAFMAGSIGRDTADRIVAAVERATRERIPLLAAPASGGTRMQEGTPAFVQMARISAAVSAHRAARLPYLVYLRHPTTGGVMASWGSLGHVTVAEPGALLGFLGPRVYETMYGEPFPAGVQVAEHLQRHGLIDAVIGPHELAEVLDRALAILQTRPAEVPPGTADAADAAAADVAEDAADADTDAWASVLRSRDPARPGVRDLLRYAAGDVLPLGGTGEGEADPTLVLALARFGDVPCVVLGEDRRRQRQQPIGPAALRTARRGMRLAAELGLPLVSVIDTPGAAMSAAAEEGGLAGEIARCLADLMALPTPTLCLMLGEGSGGGALALMPADRVIAARHSWLSPLPPEGASAIVHRDTVHAPELARAQRIRALDLRALGIVDRIVPERPDAAEEAVAFCRRTGAVLASELRRLFGADVAELVARRPDRYAAAPAGR